MAAPIARRLKVSPNAAPRAHVIRRATRTPVGGIRHRAPSAGAPSAIAGAQAPGKASARAATTVRERSAMRGTTINIDTGGTFTDAFVVRDGKRFSVKTLTTPHDLAVCFREVIARAADTIGLNVPDLLRETATVRYATTVGTNAIITRSGPRLGLIASDGGDRLYAENGEAERAFELFLDPQMVAPVPRGAERGEAPVEAAKALLSESARGLVCSLPEADRDPGREDAIREQFEQHYPKHCLDAVPLLLSHEIATDSSDFRRTVTALFNAYVHPAVADFLYRAEDHLRENGYRRPLLVVHNDGGAARVAKTIAGRTYNSGPLAGLMGAKVVADLYGIDRLVTMDMGGTSLDIAFVVDGDVPVRQHGLVEGLEISFPLPDLLALGAGGGSIAHARNGELLVGPQSAGAKPGPACFGFGGTQPTVTDADVVLGILHPERFLGGTMPLDRELAERAIANIAGGRDPVEVAAEIATRVHEEMGGQIRDELLDRGLEPAETVMLAFGGNGPLHACGMADVAGIRDILTVPFASVFSAFGASSADVRHTYVEAAPDGVDEALRRRALRDMRGEGFAPDEVEVEIAEVQRDGDTLTQLSARARLDHYEFARVGSGNGGGAKARAESREVYWPGTGFADTAIFDAAALWPGIPVEGPAVIEGSDTTYAIPAGWTYRVDEYGNGRLTAR
jgi:N-methylhydantoinase A/oxoprolinase/acetone carboxylase beta subunit